MKKISTLITLAFLVLFSCGCELEDSGERSSGQQTYDAPQPNGPSIKYGAFVPPGSIRLDGKPMGDTSPGLYMGY